MNTSPPTNSYIHPQFARNGSVLVHGVTPYQIYGYNKTSANSYMEGIGRTDIIYCSAGDYITGQAYISGANFKLYSNYSSISFCLLSAA